MLPDRPLLTLPGTPAFTASPAHRRKQPLTHLDTLHAVAPAATSASGERLDRVTQAVLGLAVQLGVDDDPVRAAALVTVWADRGARLGVSLASGP
ncbi:MAG: hypothetical protein WCK89_08990 [bacterium]